MMYIVVESEVENNFNMLQGASVDCVVMNGE